MSITVTPSFANVDPNQPNPTNIQGLLDIENTLFNPITISTADTFVSGDSTPAVSDQDRAWLKTDSAGRPLGIYLFYNGSWRRFYNGNTDELRMFRGDPAIHFDGTGLGIIGGQWDGWAICNGNNGTDNWSDLFPVYGRMDNVTISGYSAGWQSNVTGAALQTGGSANTSIINDNLPNMTVQLSGRVGYDDNASGSGQDPAAIVSKKWYGNPTPAPIPILATFGANPSGTPAVPQVPVSTTPPFKAAALCQFVGYA